MKNYLFAYAFVFGAAGCFNPDLTTSNFKCDPSGDPTAVCPTGYVCSSLGLCVLPGTPTPTPDLAGTLPTTPEDAAGCPLAGSMIGKGFLVSPTGKPKVYACPVKYRTGGSPNADAQCRAPYSICSTATNIDLAECTKVGASTNGFFIANVKGNRKGETGTANCGQPFGQNNQLLWAGCGRAVSTIASCQQFTAAIDCNATQGPSVQCTGYNINEVANSDANSGVLCCSPN